MSRNKWLVVICDVVIIFALLFYFMKPTHHVVISKNIKIDGVVLPTPQNIGPFQLKDQNDHPFTQNQLKNHWTFMFFGFTNCGMVCPTTLTELNKMYKTLQKDLPEKQLPQIVFVTVDPDRDTTKRIKGYMNSFNKNFIGTRASIEDTVNLEKRLHIIAAKIQIDGQGKDRYTIDHSAEILLFNPAGQLQAYFSYPHKHEQMVKDYKSLLTSIS